MMLYDVVGYSSFSEKSEDKTVLIMSSFFKIL